MIPIPAHIRLVIIHPDANNKLKILHQLLHCYNAYYINVNRPITSYEEFEPYLPDAPEKTLAIDNADRVDENVLPSLVSHLVQNHRLLLNTREFPSVLLEDDQLKQNIMLVPQAQHLRDFLSLERPLLEIFALSYRKPRLNGRILHHCDDDLRCFLIYLLQQGKTEILRSIITQEYFEDAPDNTTAFVRDLNNLTKYQLIDLTPTRLYLNTSALDIWYDATLFTDALDTAIETQDIPTLETLLTDYRHPTFHPNNHCTWIIHETEKLRDMLISGYSLLGNHYAANNQDFKAMLQYQRANARNRQREDIVHQLAKLYMKHNLPCETVQLGQSLEEAFQIAGLEYYPSPELGQLMFEAQLQCP